MERKPPGLSVDTDLHLNNDKYDNVKEVDSPKSPQNYGDSKSLLSPSHLQADKANNFEIKLRLDKEDGEEDKPGDNDYWTDDEEEESAEDLSPNLLSRVVIMVQKVIKTAYRAMSKVTKGYLPTAIALIIYLVYFIRSMTYEFGSEPSRRLLVCTVLGALIGFRHLLWRGCVGVYRSCCGEASLGAVGRRRVAAVRFFTRWIMYGGVAALVIYTLIEEGRKNPENLRSVPGLLVLLLVTLLCSTNPGKINWHTIYWAVGLQFMLALTVLKWKAGKDGILWIQERLDHFFHNTEAGSKLIFGDSYKDHYMVFGAMPIVFFSNATIAILYYLGAIQFLVRIIGKAITFVLDTSPVESMGVASGIFLEGIVAILCLRPYLSRCSKSQLFTIITSIFSSLGGAYLAILSSLGVSLEYLIPAMVVSAPATFAVCKLMVPETKWKSNNKDKTLASGSLESQQYSSMFDAFQTGALSMLALVGNVIVIAYAFFSYIEWFNTTLAWFGDRAGIENLSVELITSYLLFPVAFCMGIQLQDCRNVAMLLGYRIGINNIIAFFKLKEMNMNRSVYYQYIAETNGTVSYTRDDIVLDQWNKTLSFGFISERSEAIITYCLCGFSSAFSVVISVGIMMTLVPNRRLWISKVAVPCLIAGNIANCMTGCFASIFY